MKSFLSSPVSTVLLLACLCTTTGYSQNQEKYIEGIAAIVGDNIILKSDLSQVVSMTALQQRIDPVNNPTVVSRFFSSFKYRPVSAGFRSSWLIAKIVDFMISLSKSDFMGRGVSSSISGIAGNSSAGFPIRL